MSSTMYGTYEDSTAGIVEALERLAACMGS